MVQGKFDETRRSHEVRIGMSLYWAYTWAEGNGFAWESGELSGWSRGSRREVLQSARHALEEREARTLVVSA